MHQVHHQHIKGSLWMLAAALSVSIYSMFNKLAVELTSPYWIVLILFATGLVLSVVTLVFTKSDLRTKRLPLHFGRAFFGVVAATLFLIAVQHIPLFNAALLLNTTPLFIPLIAIILLGAKLPLRLLWALILGFIGVVFIIHPTAEIYKQLFSLVGLASGISLAFAFVFVKMLSSTESHQKIIFYLMLFGTLLLLPFVKWYGPVPPLKAWLYSAACGALFMLQQFFVISSYRLSDASHVGPLQFMAIFFVGIWEWLIWNQAPDLRVYIGSVLIIAGSIFSLTLIAKKT